MNATIRKNSETARMDDAPPTTLNSIVCWKVAFSLGHVPFKKVSSISISHLTRVSQSACLFFLLQLIKNLITTREKPVAGTTFVDSQVKDDPGMGFSSTTGTPVKPILLPVALARASSAVSVVVKLYDCKQRSIPHDV